MSSQLIKIPFDESLLPRVQEFDCGDQPWEREVADWLKGNRGQGSALDDLDNGSHVWLYASSGGEIVGVGSFGQASLRWPRNKDPKIGVSIIPMVGVDRRFQGQPPGPRAGRYANQILSDLIAEATNYRTERPILMLYVNEKNEKAIAWYQKWGFDEFGKPYVDSATGFVNKRFVLRL